MLEDFITVAEFARRIGVTQTTVRSAVKKGRIHAHRKCAQGKIYLDWEKESIRYIESSNDPLMFYRRLGWEPPPPKDPPKKKRRKHKVKNFKDPRKNGSPPDEDENDGYGDEPDIEEGMTLSQARAAKELYLARQAKVKYEKLKGALISSEEMERDWEEIAGNLQQSLMAIPDRIDALLAAESDRERCNKIVRDELIHSLESISDAIEEKASKAQADFTKILETSDVG